MGPNKNQMNGLLIRVETMIDADSLEEIAFLSRSPVRVELLHRIERKQAPTCRDLRDDIDASRTTIQRNLKALVDKGWIEKSDNVYICTFTGNLLCSAITELADSIETLHRLEPILEHVSRSDLDLNIQQLHNAKITVATPSNPYAPVNRHVEALQTAHDFRLSTAVVGRDAFEQVWEQTVQNGCDGELVLTNDAFEIVRSDSSYADLYRELLDVDNVELSVYDGDLPYYLGIVDDIVQVGVEDETGVPKALLESDSPAVREWAIAKHETYRCESEPI